MNFDQNGTTGLSSPANNFLRQSLYIAALDRHLGIRGLISPVTDDESGLNFDFFCPTTGTLIKVFKSLDQDAISRYQENHREKNIVIVDAVALEQVECDECGDMHPNWESKELYAVASALMLIFTSMANSFSSSRKNATGIL